MNHQTAIKMNVDQFLAWYEGQPSGRFELFNGEVVQMSPERSQHNLIKFYVARALTEAIKASGAECIAYTDGMGVRINKHNRYEPDASIQAGKSLDKDATELTKPIVVVEVLSPSSNKIDTMTKLSDYLSVASIAHYLVIDGDRETVVHHRRLSKNECETRFFTEGLITLDPPGVEVAVLALFGKI
jgi:Uma2 family endonuclease